MKSKVAFWAVAATASIIYAIMIVWSLPKITQTTGGLLPFDVRPAGYSFEEAKAFLAALGAEGIEFYLNVQHRLDMVFPAFEALAVGWAIVLLAPKSWNAWRFVLALPIFIGMIFDYLENAATKAMLLAGPNAITQDMVSTASTYTITKSIFVAMGLTILLGMIVWWFVRRRNNR